MLYKRLIWLIRKHPYPAAQIYLKKIFHFLTLQTSKLPKTVAKKKNMTSFPCSVRSADFLPYVDAPHWKSVESKVSPVRGRGWVRESLDKLCTVCTEIWHSVTFCQLEKKLFWDTIKDCESCVRNWWVKRKPRQALQSLSGLLSTASDWACRQNATEHSLFSEQ